MDSKDDRTRLVRNLRKTDRLIIGDDVELVFDRGRSKGVPIVVTVIAPRSVKITIVEGVRQETETP